MKTTLSLIARCSDFALRTELEDIPATVREQALDALTDYLAVTYAGSQTRIIGELLQYVQNRGRNLAEEATVVGHAPLRCSAADAVMINGTAAHCLDYDDVSISTIGHTGAVLGPVAFALAEKHRLPGSELLRCYIVATEIQHKIAGLSMPILTERGWHTTSVFGVLGAALLSGLAMGLGKQQLGHALGIAASKASGIRVQFGTTSKPYHAGMAAEDGIRAAELAGSGLEASHTALEGPDGFFEAFAGLRRGDLSALELGEPWDLEDPGLLFKKYPCCSASHTAIDAVLELRDRFGFSNDSVASITVEVPGFTFKNLIFDEPKNASQARFSMPFVIAIALMHGTVRLEHFLDEHLGNSQVQSLSHRISMVASEIYTGSSVHRNEPARVTVRLTDGRELQSFRNHAKGTRQNPLSREEQVEKIRQCLSFLNKDRSVELFDAVHDIERRDEVRSLLSF